ncbi:uncharacterized protein [Nicotiana tomentosiformis]|uniref:uncharacterized protein n=1 Tax=Nicotiana tomentosiformis TaxID=4098 RepID=UPI00388CA288
MVLQLDPPVLTGANPEEDPQDFIDEMHKTLWVMCATETEGVELAAYRLPPERGGLFLVAFSQATEDCKLKNRRERKSTSKARSAGNIGESFDGGRSAFKGGLRGHIQRECRSPRQGTGSGTTQPASSAAATSSAPPPARGPPAPVGCGAARGGA